MRPGLRPRFPESPTPVRVDGLIASNPMPSPPPIWPPFRRASSVLCGSRTGVTFMTQGELVRTSLASASLHWSICFVFQAGSAAISSTTENGKTKDFRIVFMDFKPSLQQSPWPGSLRARPLGSTNVALQLHQQGEGPPLLFLAQIRSPARNDRTGVAVVASGRRHAAWAGEVRHVGSALGKLNPPGDKLRRHIVEGGLVIVCFEGLARILGEVGRAGGRRRAVDRWQQHQVAARIVHPASADRRAKLVVTEPEALIRHAADEVLRWSGGSSMRAYHFAPLGCSRNDGRSTAAALATDVEGERHRHAMQEMIRIVVFFVLETVVLVRARAMRVGRVLARGIAVEHE